MSNHVAIVCPEQIIDEELKRQMVFQESLICGNIRAKHRLVQILVLLMAFCNIRHHQRKHSQLGVEGIVKTERSHWFIERFPIVRLHIKPLLVNGCCKRRIPDAKRRAQVDGCLYVIIRIPIYWLHQAYCRIILISLHC